MSDISLDTNAILGHSQKLIYLAREYPNVTFVVSTVVLGEIFQKRTDEFHQFAKQIGKGRWKLGADWQAKMLACGTKQLLSEDVLGSSRTSWSWSQKYRIFQLVRVIKRYKKRYAKFLGRKRAQLRSKFELLKVKFGIPKDASYFQFVETAILMRISEQTVPPFRTESVH